MASLSQTVLFPEEVFGPLDAARKAIERAFALHPRFDLQPVYERTALPDVVQDLDVDDIEKAALIAQSDGIPVAWVPRLSIIKDLINLPDEVIPEGALVVK